MPRRASRPTHMWVKSRQTVTLGAKIKRRRLALGLTQRELAQSIGIRASHIAYIEGGHRRPSLSLLARLAKRLDLRKQELFFLAFPEVAPIIETRARGRKGHVTDPWSRFARDALLLKIHRVTKAELKLLQQVNLLGTVAAPRDFLFILSTIRQALQDE